MVLTFRRLVTRIFGADQIEQQFTVLEPQQTPEWEHYFPRHDQEIAAAEPADRGQAAPPRRESALRAQ